jgi:putative transposase
VTNLTEDHGLPVQRACQIARCSRTAFYRAQRANALTIPADVDAPVITALQAVLERHGRWGFWKCFERLRALGHAWNHKRVYRVYCALGLNQVRRTKKRLPNRDVVPLNAPPQLNTTWAMDFMGDSLYSGRSYRLLNVLDEGNREALAIEVDFSLPSPRVVAVLDELVAQYGAPRQLRCDNGPEFIADAVRTWCESHGITLAFIEPGKPNQNAYIERFNRSFREEVLDAWVFTSLAEVRAVSEEWRHGYNTERSHESLGNVPPLTFLPRPTNATPSNFKLCA